MSSVLFITLLAALTLNASAQSRWVQGTYQNPALGYEIAIPKGLRGRTGDQSGPERGFRIHLPSAGQISVWSEPNALEFASAAEAMRNQLEYDECPADGFTVLATRVGRLEGAEGALTCGERTTRILLAFHSGRGLLYWMHLTTTASNAGDDIGVLKRLASSLRMIQGMSGALCRGYDVFGCTALLPPHILPVWMDGRFVSLPKRPSFNRAARLRRSSG